MAAILTDADLPALQQHSGKIYMIDFWATWCPPCIALGPTIDALALAYDGKINVAKVNTDENPQISLTYGVTNLPCVLFIKDGVVIDKHVGLAARNVYERKIEKLLG